MFMLKELIDNHKDIIINTDIDGILSGCLLHKYYNANIVGFSNSKDKIWSVPSLKKLDKPVYIDIFISNPKIASIDQHIIAIDDIHSEELKNNPLKMNPNLDINRNFLNNYNFKYPFGTVHYLLALMTGEGIEVELPNLENYIKGFEYITLGKMLLRADDALYSTQGPYSYNAKQWWEYLMKLSNNSPIIQSLISYIETLDKNRAWQIKNETNHFFINVMKCTGGDGAFDEITDADGNLSETFLNFFNCICIWFEFGNIEIPKKYNINRGIFKKHIATKNDDFNYLKSFLTSERMFSYAFIFGPNKTFTNQSSFNGNLSYTFDLKLSSKV